MENKPKKYHIAAGVVFLLMVIGSVIGMIGTLANFAAGIGG